MRIGYCSWGMMNVDIEEVVPAVAGIGYHGLELAVTPNWPTELYSLDAGKRRRIAELLDQYDLVLTGVAGHTSMCEDDPEKNAVNMKRLRDTIDLTDELRQDGEPAITASLIGSRSVWRRWATTLPATGSFSRWSHTRAQPSTCPSARFG